MKKTFLQQGSTWLLFFFLIFCLTQDYLFAQWPDTKSVFGFPGWLFWFMGVHLLLVFVFYQFGKRFWKD